MLQTPAVAEPGQGEPGSSRARLRSAGLRVTRPRVAVLDVLEDARPAQEHLTAAAIGDRVRRRTGSVSTQGIYDCLEALTEAGLARRIEPAGHATLYEARVGDNHHHVVCRSCGRTTDVDCVVGRPACLTPSDAEGFIVQEAEVTFWGLCPACASDSPDQA